jgi:hypothetical protein
MRLLTPLTPSNRSGNSLNGALPEEWDAPALEVLDMSYNGFTWTLPAQLTGAPNVRTVSFNDNSLTGGLPAEWASLEALEELLIGRLLFLSPLILLTLFLCSISFSLQYLYLHI